MTRKFDKNNKNVKCFKKQVPKMSKSIISAKKSAKKCKKVPKT